MSIITRTESNQKVLRELVESELVPVEVLAEVIGFDSQMAVDAEDITFHVGPDTVTVDVTVAD